MVVEGPGQGRAPVVVVTGSDELHGVFFVEFPDALSDFFIVVVGNGHAPAYKLDVL